MRVRRLRTRFLLAGCLLVATTAAGSLWSALTFARLSRVVGDTLQESQETIDLSAELAGSLEREDDALLLALSGDPDKARQNLAAERRRGDAGYDRLLVLLRDGEAEERAIVAGLKDQVAAYRAAGDELLTVAARPDALVRYHHQVNPLLRLAVAGCDKLREANFRSMREAGVSARDEADRATGIVAGVSVAGALLASAVAVWLTRSVVDPLRAMTGAVDALGRGDYDRRSPPFPVEELDQLAAGFNRAAESLAEYRRSSLGELLVAKMTLEATLDALPDAVIVIAPGGAVAATNPPARALLAAKGAAGAGTVEALPLLPEHRSAVDAALAGKPTPRPRTDFRLALPAVLDGRPVRYLVSAAPVPTFEPGRTGAVVVLDDVTDFARLDELRSELIGLASHELKTPLTAIRMNLLLLGERPAGLSPRQQEMLAAAVQGCEELGGTIEEMLDVTRVEAGQLRLNLAPVDVYAVIAAAVRGLRPRFDDAGVTVDVVRDCEPAVVRGDAARLGLVLNNLLTNALKYSPAGGRVIIRASAGGAGPAGPVEIAVSDQGPGVPAEFRERVFEKFFRVEHHRGTERDGARGTGIGLYLCREIVRAHGCEIECGAGEHGGEHGIGARIAFTLPAA
ncbi:MAG: multi-sensor signal transduction histidine kinase [Gemmataceae bacterium]|nr:multi-sensor signal transduction histidine kinase [Gemmataceae bacterium]